YRRDQVRDGRASPGGHLPQVVVPAQVPLDDERGLLGVAEAGELEAQRYEVGRRGIHLDLAQPVPEPWAELITGTQVGEAQATVRLQERQQVVRAPGVGQQVAPPSPQGQD